MARALGLSVHTGWAACVLVSGSLEKPEILANLVIELLGDPDRFCYHRAAELEPGAAREWLARVRAKALATARRALAPLAPPDVSSCAIAAKAGDDRPLELALSSHPWIHAAEGSFYRDVLRDAVGIPVQIISPASLDVSAVGRLTSPPWGKDQKLAALAAWSTMPQLRRR